MKKNYKTKFNELLYQYNKDRRRLANLQLKNRNVRRQSLLEKRIIQLYQKLLELKRLIKLTTAATAAFIGLSLAVPQTTQAQGFLAPQENPFGLTGIPSINYANSTPAFVDLNGDGKLDMVSGGNYGNFFYYEDTSSTNIPAFADSVRNPFGLIPKVIGEYFSTTPAFVDLDGDGDMDMVSGGADGNFYYYKNIGTSTAPAFDTAQVNPFGLTALPSTYSAPVFVDLDGDGDMDMISGDYYGNFYYYQNTGTSTAPVFAAPVENPFGLTALPSNGYSSPTFVDMDGDGDMDMVSGASYSGNFYYYKNTGTPTAPAFDTAQVNPFGLTALPSGRISSPTFVDIDGDGDMDMVSGDFYGNFYYYEDSLGTNAVIDKNKIATCKMYPNPVNNKLNVSGSESISLVKVYGMSGKLLETVTPKANNGNISIDFEKYQKGMYLVKLYFKEGDVKTKLIAK